MDVQTDESSVVNGPCESIQSYELLRFAHAQLGAGFRVLWIVSEIFGDGGRASDFWLRRLALAMFREFENS
jgi:hypothetical protein